MAKLTLTDLASITNQTSTVTAINNNNEAIEAALENTLSRDGTTPNTMGASLDMNSNRIFNLPTPLVPTDAARLQDIVNGVSVNFFNANTYVSSFMAGVLSITSSANLTSTLGLPSLGSTNTFTGNNYFKTGYPWADVRAWGAVGDGSTNDSAAFQSAINALQANSVGGGILWVPPGNYLLSDGILITGPVRVIGSGKSTTILQSWHVDTAPVVTVRAVRAALESLSVFGKGSNGDTGAFGATHNALVIDAGSVEVVIRDVLVQGGYYAIASLGDDNYFEHVLASASYGPAAVYTNEANWYIRCKFDHGQVFDLNGRSAWASTTAYSLNDIVTNGNYAMLCTHAGTSGSVLPTLKNFGLTITDGATVTWTLLAYSSYEAVRVDTGAGENHFTQCDFSGSFASSINQTAGATNATTVVTDCVLSNRCDINAGSWFALNGCEVGGKVTIVAGYAGKTLITDSEFFNVPIEIGAAVNYAILTNLDMGGATITIDAGAGSNIFIDGISNGTVVDGGTGAIRTNRGQRTTPIGYMVGAGGVVTQSTDKATTVVLNTLSGKITTNNAALAAATIVSFTLTNSQIAATDVLILNHLSGGTVGSYTLNAQAGAGSATINIRNNTAGSLSEAVVISFVVIKGAIT